MIHSPPPPSLTFLKTSYSANHVLWYRRNKIVLGGGGRGREFQLSSIFVRDCRVWLLTLEDLIESMKAKLLESFSTFLRNGSGWTLKSVETQQEIVIIVLS